MQQKPKEKTTSVISKEKHRINEEITVHQVFLIGPNGEQLGVKLLKEALLIAEDEGLDVVEVAPDASPPVCRILDYGKLKYKEQKRAAEARKRSSTHSLKELRIRYSTDTHDLETKVRAARKFILEGDKVKFQMRFRGREVTYGELGEQTLKTVAEKLEDISVVEEFSPLIGMRMSLTLAPKGAAPKVKGEKGTS